MDKRAQMSDGSRQRERVRQRGCEKARFCALSSFFFRPSHRAGGGRLSITNKLSCAYCSSVRGSCRGRGLFAVCLPPTTRGCEGLLLLSFRSRIEKYATNLRGSKVLIQGLLSSQPSQSVRCRDAGKIHCGGNGNDFFVALLLAKKFHLGCRAKKGYRNTER